MVNVRNAYILAAIMGAVLDATSCDASCLLASKAWSAVLARMRGPLGEAAIQSLVFAKTQPQRGWKREVSIKKMGLECPYPRQKSAVPKSKLWVPEFCKAELIRTSSIRILREGL
jgi:hypothetical protein